MTTVFPARTQFNPREASAGARNTPAGAEGRGAGRAALGPRPSPRGFRAWRDLRATDFTENNYSFFSSQHSVFCALCLKQGKS